jgi:two-component system, chemotaxis family, protein-glutamate methylesterase/glutaminase
MTETDGQLVALGASWGGLEVTRAILRALPPDLGASVVVAQHRSAESTRSGLRDLLAGATSLPVREAEDKDELLAGTVYLAPPDYHLMVQGRSLALSTDAPVQYARPSIDVLFSTAAESYRERCVGVVLTGANADGARGLARIAELGGTAIVQDPHTAARAEMPTAALAAVPHAHVARVGEIAGLIVERCGIQTAAA